MSLTHTNEVSNPSFVRAFFGTLSPAFARGMKRIQVGKMIAVLNGFSDSQLEDIGVKRGEIAQHAESLVKGPA